MHPKAVLVRTVTLLVLLALLVGSSGSTAQAQDSVPPSSTGPADPSVTTEAAAAAAPTPGLNYQSFGSMMFSPNSNSIQYTYNFGSGTQYLTAGTFAEFHMPLNLPNGVEVRELTAMFRDNQPSADLVVGLCRVANENAAVGCVIKYVDTSLSGNTGSLVTRTATGSPITTIDNYTYNYFLVVALNAASPNYGLVSMRVGYSNSAFLPAVIR